MEGKKQLKNTVMKKRKNHKSESAVRARQDREEDLESIYSEVQKKHGDSYSGPQLHLWARMIVRELMMIRKNDPKFR